MILERWNKYSQNGEDGVIESIFRRIGQKNQWCVELGAWDGKLYSNTRHLVEHGWTAVLFECDRARFHEIARGAEAGGGFVYAENLLVTDLDDALSGQQLSGVPLPIDFDLLSIDVDGRDYQLWDGLESFKPRVVVIEVNSSYPVTSYVQFDDERGSSLAAMVRLGETKGYALVKHTGNAVFVQRELLAPTEIVPWKELFDASWVKK